MKRDKYMQTTKHLATALLTVCFAMLTWNCGGGGGDDPDIPTPTPTPTPTPEPTPTPTPTGKFFTLTCDMEPRTSETTVTLTGLTSAVTRAIGSASWLNVALQPYVSGAPQAKLSVSENSQRDVRSQGVTFYAANDTLVLTVRQAAFSSEGGTDMEQPFDTPSEQPGFSRQP